jgi:hypothetical protein
VQEPGAEVSPLDRIDLMMAWVGAPAASATGGGRPATSVGEVLDVPEGTIYDLRTSGLEKVRNQQSGWRDSGTAG